MKSHYGIAHPAVIGLAFSAPHLADKETDTIIASNGNPQPLFISFWNPTGLPISYEGSPVESLELAPGGLFIGVVKEGNIIPQHGKLTPISLVPAPNLNGMGFSQLVFKDWEGTVDQIPALVKAQRVELNKIKKALKALRDANKLSKEQEEDI